MELRLFSSKQGGDTDMNNGEDLISRRDAIAYFFRPYSNEELYSNTDIEKALNALPSAEPKHGEWIFNPKDAIESMFTKPKCSECGFESSDGGNFCPNCGSDMRKGGAE